MDLIGKRILVTGANGFIGGRLAERLANLEGAIVRGLVRQETSKVPGTFEVYFGDITDEAAVQRAVAGCDVVVHCAAMQGRGSLKEFRRVNVDGTLNVLRAARAANVGRFVHLSTINVHGYPPPQNANANSPLVFNGDAYSVSKAEAERAARIFSDEHDLPLTIVRPACTYGPGSVAWTLTPLARVKRGVPVLIGRGDGLCNAVYIDNLIDLLLLAMENDAAVGQAFIGAEGRAVTWRDFYGAYAEMLGERRLGSVPRRIALVLGMVSESAARVSGRPPLISRSSVDFYSHHVVFQIDKSRQMLAYEPRVSFKAGMQKAREWLEANSLIPGKM